MPRLDTCIECFQGTEELRNGRCPNCQGSDPRAFYQTKQWRKLAKQVTNQGCAICGSHHRVTAHHLRARRHGGKDEHQNLVPLCGSHHSQYEARKRAGVTDDLTRTVEGLGPSAIH